MKVKACAHHGDVSLRYEGGGRSHRSLPSDTIEIDLHGVTSKYAVELAMSVNNYYGGSQLSMNLRFIVGQGHHKNVNGARGVLKQAIGQAFRNARPKSVNYHMDDFNGIIIVPKVVKQK